MIMPAMFVRCRWQSKHRVLSNLVKNRGIIRPMCASEDEECASIRGQDLSDDEWNIVQVMINTLTCQFLLEFSFSLLFI
jgi:hypothetical protein